MIERQRAIPVPIPIPLASFEREGLAAALNKAGLPASDIQSDTPLFWRFENANNPVPVGFGGLEIFGNQALMRSVVTLPPVRKRGLGTHFVALLETEARIRGAHTIWIATGEAAVGFFARLGYRACERTEAPKPVQTAIAFVHPAASTAMVKRLD